MRGAQGSFIRGGGGLLRGALRIAQTNVFFRYSLHHGSHGNTEQHRAGFLDPTHLGRLFGSVIRRLQSRARAHDATLAHPRPGWSLTPVTARQTALAVALPQSH